MRSNASVDESRYMADCTKQTYTAGQEFTELGNSQTVYVRNEGTTTAEVYATLVVPNLNIFSTRASSDVTASSRN